MEDDSKTPIATIGHSFYKLSECPGSSRVVSTAKETEAKRVGAFLVENFNTAQLSSRPM